MKTSCTQCSAAFEITDEDLAFYDNVSPVFDGKKELIPPPTLCPQCRYQRRLACRNERTLYHRKCDLSGRPMISMHPADSPFPVYHITEWLTDKWDPKTYGRDFDFSKPFFEQFHELCTATPHFNAFVDPHMDINSEYTNCSSEAKNCYLITQAEKNEDCYYARGINNCKNCCDCYRVHKCELCYECIDANNCYNCRYCQDCDNSTDCWFSSDLRGCKFCFGCHGLAQKEYHIFNKPVTKKEWEQKIGTLKLSHDIITQMQEQSAATRLKTPQRAIRQINCEDVIGDHVTNSRASKYVFDSNDLEHCAYCNEIANGSKNCYDYCMWGIGCELLYECDGCGYNAYHCLFSNHCWQNVGNLLYCESCFPSVRDCFGCFGLRNARYCILNKQYTKEEYEKLVPKIIENMRKERMNGAAVNPSEASGSWGEFFPIAISAYAYNESLAQLFFPLTEEEAKKRKYRWRDDDGEGENYMGPEVNVPATIGDVSDDICESILRCEATKKPYRITAQELKFYRTMGLPIPKKSPHVRHVERHNKRNRRMLFESTCAKCGAATLSTFGPDRPEKVYCEECYLKEVY